MWNSNPRKPPFLYSGGLFEKYHSLSPFHKAVIISKHYRVHLYLKKTDVVSLKNMAWRLTTVSVLNLLAMKTRGKNIGKEAEEHVEMALTIMFMVELCRVLSQAGFVEPGGISDPLVYTKSMREAPNVLEGLPDMKLGKINEFVTCICYGKEALRDESEHTIWNIIFNSAVSFEDKRDGNNGIAQYTSWNELLGGYLEQEEILRCAKVRDAMDVY